MSVMELRTCIAILFSFQRRPMRDERFVRDTQEWLSRLVAILVRVGNWQDHMFLLNHILRFVKNVKLNVIYVEGVVINNLENSCIRCPAGVGLWASSFLQTPIPVHLTIESNTPFDSPYLDHAVVALATIILPIRERVAFLEQVS